MHYKFLSLLLCFSMIGPCIPIQTVMADTTQQVTKQTVATIGDEITVDQIQYRIMSGSRVAAYGIDTGFTGTKLTIPSSITYDGQEYQVTQIARDGFKQLNEVEEIVVSDGITSIGYQGFSDSDNQVTSLSLPKSLESVDGGLYFPQLKTITLDEENTSFCVINHALYSKDQKTLYMYPSLENETDVSVKDGVQTIEAGAFAYHPYMKTLHLPSSVQYIYDKAFYQCEALTKMTWDNGLNNYIFIQQSAFENCTQLSSVMIPDACALIGEEVFKNTAITSIDLSHCSSLYAIGNFAFAKTKLTTLRIPKSVLHIGNGICYDNSNFERFEVDFENPNYLTDADGVLYESCVDEMEDAYHDSLKAYPEGRKDETYEVMCDCDRIASYAFAKTPYLKKVITDKVDCVQSYAFDHKENEIQLYLNQTATNEDDTILEYLAFSNTDIPISIYFKDEGTKTYVEEHMGLVFQDAIISNVSLYVNEEKSHLSLETSSQTMITGESLPITAYIDEEEAEIGQVQFSSTNENVATVDEAGEITGVGVGQCYILATYGDETKKCVVTVKRRENAPTAFYFNEKEMTLKPDELDFLDYTLSPYYFEATDVKWESSDESVVSVSENATIATHKEGTATITGTTENGLTDTCTIIVAKDAGGPSVEINQTKLHLHANDTAQLQLLNTTGNIIDWHSDDEEIASVNENGIVTANGYGTTRIYADYREKSYACEVSVSDTTLKQTSMNIKENETAQLEIENTYVTISDIPWESTDETIATVDQNGLITGKKEGTTTITGVIGNKTLECEVKVDNTEIPAVIPKEITDVSTPEDVVYNGEYHCPNVMVSSENKVLEKDKDYTVTYEENKNCGTAKVIVTGIGEYTGTMTTTFRIIPKTMSEVSTPDNVTYNGDYHYPSVTVKDGDLVLQKGIDYKLSYQDNQSCGVAKIIVSGMGNYTGSIEKTFKIIPRSISYVSTPNNVVYNGNDQYPSVTVKDGEVTLKKDVNYQLSYENNRNRGVAKVIVTGIGNYSGTITKTFNIVSKNITYISTPKNVTYNGKNQYPNIVVKSGNTTLRKNQDYKIAYSGNKNCGKAKVMIIGIGNYAGTKTTSFTIIPKKAKIKKVKAGSKQLKVSIAKSSGGVSGYQIRYSLKKNMKGSKYKYTSKTSMTVKKLKKKKNYYIQIRAYKTISGKKYYGNWSSYKKCKTK